MRKAFMSVDLGSASGGANLSAFLGCVPFKCEIERLRLYSITAVSQTSTNYYTAKVTNVHTSAVCIAGVCPVGDIGTVLNITPTSNYKNISAGCPLVVNFSANGSDTLQNVYAEVVVRMHGKTDQYSV